MTVSVLYCTLQQNVLLIAEKSSFNHQISLAYWIYLQFQASPLYDTAVLITFRVKCGVMRLIFDLK